MKRCFICIISLFFFLELQAQNSRNVSIDTIAYLSKVDSLLLVYIYPQIKGIENKINQERMNAQVKDLFLPDNSVLDKLEKVPLQNINSIKNSGIQKIHVSITYMNDLLVCLQTRISVTSPSMLGMPGDMYYNTISIASGNEYMLNNLFTKNIYNVVYLKNMNTLSAFHIDENELKEHLIGFGLIWDEACKNCITLQIILNNMYGPEGPTPLELYTEDILPLINADGPLNKLLEN